MIDEHAFAALLDRAAAPLTAGANHPIDLCQEDQVLLIEKGQLNVFAQQQKDGMLTGMRTVVNQFTARDILFPFPSSEASDLTIEAVAEIGSVIRPIPLQTFLDHFEPAWEFTVNRTLAQYLSPVVNPKPTQETAENLPTNQKVTLEPQAIRITSDRLLWVHLSEGAVTDENDHVHEPQATPFPLVPGQGITNHQTSPADIQTHSTAALAASGDLGKALNATLHTLAIQLRDRCLDATEAFSETQATRAAVFAQRLAGVTRSLATVATGRDLGTGFGEDDNHPLIGAFRQVASAAAIPLPERFPELQDDTTAPIRRCAQIAQVQYRAIKLTGAWWEQNQGPLLGAARLETDPAPDEEDELQEETLLPADCTPVALIPQRSSGGYVMRYQKDGEFVERPVTAATAAVIQTKAAMFYRPIPEEPMSIADFVRFSMAFTAPDFLRIFVGGFTAALLLLLVPIATGHLVDTVVPSNDSNELFITIGALGIVVLTVAVLQFYTGLAVLRVETRASTAMLAGLVDRLVKLPASFFRRFNAGELTAKVMGVETARQTLTEAVMNTLVTAVFSFVYLILMLFYSWKLALVALIGLIVLYLIVFGIAWLQIQWEKKIQDGHAKVGGISLQMLTGAEKVKTAAAESQMFSLWGRAFAKLRRYEFDATFSRNVMDVVEPAFLPVTTTLIFWIYVLYVQGWTLDQPIAVLGASSLSTGDFLSFNSALTMMAAAATNFAMALMMVVKVVPIITQSEPILAEAVESSATKGDPGTLTGHIEFSHITFGYAAEAPPVLDDLSFEIQPGEFVALVGPSGSGKSTVLRLLLGLEDARSGQVLYDSQPLSELNLQALRRQIGTVMQNGRLMSGDIRDNIIGESLLTMEHAWEAARQADIATDIEGMPMGMFTVVSGGTLSGGQRQRVLIARALVNRPSILFFDEATSALDDETQAKVAASIDRLKATRIVIAHRLSTIRNADRIIVLERGKIVQEGTYEKLAQQDGLFRELVRRQTT